VSLSVLIPAHDEAGWIGACLGAVLGSAGDLPADRRIVVVANGCSDDTAAIARARLQGSDALGWQSDVIETAEGGKTGALNLADAAAGAGARVYLDADVTVSPDLLASLCAALADAAPRYATGTAVIPKPRSRISRAYGRFWQTLPFVTEDAPGFGLFAVNAAGRARWDAFPDVISDDTYVRLHFAPHERARLPQTYAWPMIEGLPRLVRVRRRQNLGVAEIARRYPSLMVNDAGTRPGLAGIARRALRDPAGFCAYAGVALAVRSPLFAARGAWDRGR
jgi:glycosyltransferase involved in cell wall biosynthesis